MTELNPMNQQPDPFEQRVRDLALRLPYPSTPDLVARRRQRPLRPTWRFRPLQLALLLLLLLVGTLLAVPEARATVLRILRIGVIEVVPADVTVPPAPLSSASPASPTPIASLLDLAGETTLAEAQATVPFNIKLPSYPTDLGPPDRIYLQNFDGTLLVLVWLDPQRRDGIRMSLHILTSSLGAQKGAIGGKTGVKLINETTVNGQWALWLNGPHLLAIRTPQGQPDYTIRRLVEGNVLLWTDGQLTYRLESDLELDEAVRVAESLR
jgi:hypothetical protein